VREGWAARRVGLLSCEPLRITWREGSKAFDNLWIQQEGMLRHDLTDMLVPVPVYI